MICVYSYIDTGYIQSLARGCVGLRVPLFLEIPLSPEETQQELEPMIQEPPPHLEDVLANVLRGTSGSPRFLLKGSLKGDIDIGIDRDVDVDIDAWRSL